MNDAITWEFYETGEDPGVESLTQRSREIANNTFEFFHSSAGLLSEPAEQIHAPASLSAEEYFGETDMDGLKAAANALEKSLFADDGNIVDSLEAEALMVLGSHRAFAALALSKEDPPDVRGVAARLFAEHASKDVTGATDMLLTALAKSPQPLVRLGLVYGFGETTNHELLRQFVNDPHPRVRMEARRLQDHA